MQRRLGLAGLFTWCFLAGCGHSSQPDLPASSPFLNHAELAQGVAVGDVTHQDAQLWLRTVGPARVRVEWVEASDGAKAPAQPRFADVTTNQEQDFTALLAVEGLRPNTEYRYRVRGGRPEGQPDQTGGRFMTAPDPDQDASVTFVWAADLGGQERCRRGAAGYPIFDPIAAVRPSFAVLLGDLIYADHRCPSPPNEAGSDFVALTLDQYRAKHRYQRGALAMQRFLATVPVYVTWDDHEVRNNFSGPHEPLMAIGRQALLEYWPVRTPPDEPGRLYRSVRWGRTLELFLLDMRQYRDRNSDQDGPNKTMLGKAQRDWLLDGLSRSTATWKVIATSVPLSIPKKGPLLAPGNDGWARGEDGTGFQTELRRIVDVLSERRIRNVIWLAADVHFAQINLYDPDRDGATDFYEFISGPLSSSHVEGILPDQTFNPTTIYKAGGLSNFGLLTLATQDARVEIRDESGSVRFTHTFPKR
jgi:alkaline phosphatase D